MARSTGSPSSGSSGGPVLNMPPGAVCTEAYVLDLIGQVRPLIATAKRVWRNGAPQELRDRLMFHIVRFVAYRELTTNTSPLREVFRTIALSVAAELRVRDARTARTIDNVIGWVCDPDNHAYVFGKRSDPSSHAEDVAAYAKKEFAREAAPKVRADQSFSYRQIEHHTDIPSTTAWRAVWAAAPEGEEPKPRRWSNEEISTLEGAMEKMRECGGQSIREVCKVVAGELGLEPDAVRQFWYRRQRKHR